MPSSTHRRHVRWRRVALAVVAVAVAAGAIAVARSHSSVKDAGKPLGYTAATEPPAEPTALFIGDSWAEGKSASSLAAAWPQLLCSHEHWRLNNAAASGAGYLHPSKTSTVVKTFSDELRRHAHDTPAVVVVSGGYDDLKHDYTDTQRGAAIASFFADLSTAFPHSEIVALSPFWPTDDVPPVVLAEQASVKAAALAHHDRYIDVTRLVVGHTNEWIWPDGAKFQHHPNDAGNAAISDYLAQRIDAMHLAIPAAD